MDQPLHLTIYLPHSHCYMSQMNLELVHLALFHKTVAMAAQCLEWITKLLLVPPTMLPVLLSAQLNGGHSQLRNELMYQCRNLLRTTTSK